MQDQMHKSCNCGAGCVFIGQRAHKGAGDVALVQQRHIGSGFVRLDLQPAFQPEVYIAMGTDAALIAVQIIGVAQRGDAQGL